MLVNRTLNPAIMALNPIPIARWVLPTPGGPIKIRF